MTTPLPYLLMLGAILFAIGLVGFLTRRNLILLFLSLELMLSGVALNAIAFGRHHGNYDGQILTIVILTIAASEAALALSLVVALNRYRKSLDVNLWRELGESQSPASSRSTLQEAVETEMTFPKLTPAGLDPLERPLPHSVPDDSPRA